MTFQEACAAHRAAMSDKSRWRDDILTDALPVEDRQWVEQLVQDGHRAESIDALARALDYGPVALAAIVAYAVRVWAEHGQERVSLAFPPAPAKVAGYIKPKGPSES